MNPRTDAVGCTAYPEGMRPRILIVGGGNMARAIVTGAVGAGQPPSRFIVVEPDAGKRSWWVSQGVTTSVSAAEVLRSLGPGDQVMLAVKPQLLAEAVKGLDGVLGDRVVVTMLAGTPSTRVRACLPSARVVRVMPNTPSRIGKGTTALALGAGSREGDESEAELLFGLIGMVIRIDESLMDAFTALAGSGPAYLFYLAEALAAAGVRVGFDEGDALRIVRSMLAGSALLLEQAGEDPADLRRAVTSKGGTTEAAIAVFDECGVREIVARAVAAACDRGRELADQA